MQYIIGDMAGVTSNVREVVKGVAEQVLKCVPPPKTRNNLEYMAHINVKEKRIYVFYASDLERCKNRGVGSFFSQLEDGLLEIGFLDLQDKNVCESVKNLIQVHWGEMVVEAHEEEKFCG